MKDFKRTYLFLRLPVAISILGHGLVRLPKLSAFSGWMVSTMEKSFIPEPFIIGFSYILPFAEFLVGLWLLIGVKSKEAIFAGITVMSILIFGSCSIENWGAIEAQLLHAGYLFLLLLFLQNYAGTPDNHVR